MEGLTTDLPASTSRPTLVLMRILGVLAAAAVLTACSKKPNAPTDRPATGQYTIGGNVVGMVGSGLLLRNNGSNDLAVTGNGAFTFTSPQASGSPYNVTIAGQPTNPSQTCTVSRASDSVGTANVTN